MSGVIGLAERTRRKPRILASGESTGQVLPWKRLETQESPNLSRTPLFPLVTYSTEPRGKMGLSMATLENRAGNYVEAACTSGLETFLNAELSPDLLGHFPDPQGAYSYPIVTFTWLLVFEKYSETSRALQVKDFVKWCLTTGQDYSEAAGNVRLAPHVIRAALTKLDSVGT